METLILIFDAGALIALLVFSMRNERRAEGEPELGPFAIVPPPTPGAVPDLVRAPVPLRTTRRPRRR